MGEQLPDKYKIIHSWELTYDWNLPSNSRAVWDNYISKDHRVLHLGPSWSECTQLGSVTHQVMPVTFPFPSSLLPAELCETE